MLSKISLGVGERPWVPTHDRRENVGVEENFACHEVERAMNRDRSSAIASISAICSAVKPS